MKKKAQIEQWLSELVNRLHNSFGSRLLLVVHVGSWARDDANEQSDIDMNVVLDRVTTSDIAIYRSVIANMPIRELACGFLGGLNEIRLWPRYDLVCFYYGSKVYYGSVEDVIGPISQKDIFDSAMIMVSNLNHGVRHAMIYEKIDTDTANSMKALYKAAFFILQYWYLLVHGEYVPKRKLLAKKAVSIEDRLILENYDNWEENEQAREENPIETLMMLEHWSSGMFFRLEEIRDRLS